MEAPSVFAGNWNWGHREGVGTNANMGVLWQGAFVKNEEYANQHKEDIYDFYVADGELWGTHPGDLIWRVTPTAEVIRYAGRGSTTWMVTIGAMWTVICLRKFGSMVRTVLHSMKKIKSFI
ncbi:hypothetical protein NXX23_10750 [Bacteroides ovatus]|nr:hypothetical protein [Bacteroides ovatus]